MGESGRHQNVFIQCVPCNSDEEMVREADRIASEHVQVMSRDPDYFLRYLKNYGALFLARARTWRTETR